MHMRMPCIVCAQMHSHKTFRPQTASDAHMDMRHTVTDGRKVSERVCGSRANYDQHNYK